MDRMAQRIEAIFEASCGAHEEATPYLPYGYPPFPGGYDIAKRAAWEEDYSAMTWEEFNDGYEWCHRCRSWQEGQCVCYAR